MIDKDAISTFISICSSFTLPDKIEAAIHFPNKKMSNLMNVY